MALLMDAPIMGQWRDYLLYISILHIHSTVRTAEASSPQSPYGVGAQGALRSLVQALRLESVAVDVVYFLLPPSRSATIDIS